jgi:cyclophilin family peptidyl-prolyl cis-trans isomerase
MNDPDARVQAAALDAWRGMRSDTTVRAVARAHLQSPDAGVRAAAASALRMAADPKDVDALVISWHLALRDPISDARLAVFGTLRALAGRHPEVLGQLGDPSHREFLQRPDDPILRAKAARTWPEVSQRWGERAPIATGKTLDDYRNIVRTLVLADSDTHVRIEVEGRGTIDIQLLGHEAPLTVANFLRLVDRHYFDGGRWHRVVPDFVVQDGDPTGTGNGGPGWSIRDEINRERYDIPMVGMALPGPDTGGSQWFINLSPQPHLDGQYTIFGKVSGTYGPLMRVVQGDLIRSIHR